MDVGFDGSRAVDDAGAGLFLRRAGALEERAQHDDDELHLAGVRRRALGRGRLFAGVYDRQQLRGRPVAGVPARGGARGAGHDSALPVHGLSGDVLHHHGRAHLGRDRRADALLRLPDLHHPVGAGGLLAGGALGVGRRLAGRPGRARLRGRDGRARQRGRGGAGGGDRRWASAATIRARRSCRTTCRSRCWAPACCGSAGSGSTPAARWPRARLRRWRLRRPSWRRWGRWWCGRCSTMRARANRRRWAAPRRSWWGWWR